MIWKFGAGTIVKAIIYFVYIWFKINYKITWVVLNIKKILQKLILILIFINFNEDFKTHNFQIPHYSLFIMHGFKGYLTLDTLHLPPNLYINCMHIIIAICKSAAVTCTHGHSTGA